MKALLRKLRRRIAKDYPRRTVSFDQTGFAVVQEEQPTTFMRWADIDTIYTRKIDLFSCDEVQLGFGQRSSNVVIEVGELHEGFKAFAEEVLQRFESIPKDWFIDVAFPPFEQKFRILWERNEN